MTGNFFGLLAVRFVAQRLTTVADVVALFRIGWYHLRDLVHHQ